MCILDNIDSIKSYGRENLCLKPEWDAPILNDQERKKKKSVSNEMERNAKSVYQEAMGKHCF